MKYINFIILSALLLLAIIFKDNIHLSTNLLSLFASKENMKKIDIASHLGYSKEMLIAIKGFDNLSKDRVNKLSKELSEIKEIEFIQSTLLPSASILTFYKTFYPLIAKFDNQIQSRLEIKVKLQSLYDNQLESAFYTAIDKNDPLRLFKLTIDKSNNFSHRGQYIALADYGYLIRVSTTVQASQMTEAKVLYNKLQNILSRYPDTVAFAPFFYTVENSQKIQADVQWIVLLSSLVLFILYYVLLKNIKLLFHTLIALSSSMIAALLLSALFFENFHILSFAFGMSITAVSIDYLLHYYFHGFYRNKNIYDRNVLYGFLTTVLAFVIFAFIPIGLIAQISFFSMVSLTFSFILFTFVFPKLELQSELPSLPLTSSSPKLSSTWIFLTSVILFIYSNQNIILDNNLRNLDYQNESLLSLEIFFKSGVEKQMIPVLVNAKSKDQLLESLHEIHKNQPDTFSLASFLLDEKKCEAKKDLLDSYNFAKLNSMINKIAVEVGFRAGYFKNSYTFTDKLPSCSFDNFKLFEHYHLSIYNENDTFYTMAFVSDITSLKEKTFVTTLDIKEMFLNVLQSMYSHLMLYSWIVILMIVALLLLSVRKRFLYAFNFILFPMSFVLAVLTTFQQINIMHIFSLIILLAIGIDYGIYLSNSHQKNKTIKAIHYSLFTTFAGFGVLIFSSITALHSIGIVITLGVVAIFTLIKVMK
jgi:uncharacterized protein